MTLMETTPPQSQGATRTPAEVRGQLLARVLELMDREGLPYCVLHGYETYPQTVEGDVDLLAPADAVPQRLAGLLRSSEATLGARLVQWFRDRAHFIVLQTVGDDGA